MREGSYSVNARNPAKRGQGSLVRDRNRLAAALLRPYAARGMPPLDGPRRTANVGGHQRARPADDPERWERVKAVFLAALERPDADRSGFVVDACAGDAELRANVESLLASEEEAASFCETPAGGLLGVDRRACGLAARLQPGTRLGAYKISAFLAAGGMGEVYRARHTVLDRVVALKIISNELADASGRRRLIREAQHASNLAHPNICTIYEIGDADDRPFIVMKYIDGRPLSEIVRETTPDLSQVLHLGMQVADALAHAHEHGIIHRDLKSSNVVVDAAGRAIVLDFGLAGTGPESRESTLTMHGELAGTLSHMAPEVLHGAQADVRSDVWAFGVLLYELATGQLPFTGRTPYETSSAILGEPPRPMGPRVPLSLRLVIERCLVKDPNGRYQRVSEVRSALDAIKRRRAWPLVGRLLVSARRRTLLAIAAAAVLIPVLVVAGNRWRDRVGGAFGGQVSTLALLPLANLTGDSSAAYYADGLTDALIAQLGALTNVRIISRASAERLSRTAKSRAEIAAQLGARVIVEGALRRASGRIAVDIRLVEPTRGRVLWSDTYDRSASEVLAMQADVVRALALATRLAVRPEAQERLATVRAVRPDVYEAYLKGRYEWNQRTQQSLQLAVAQFTRAVELDPSYAPAHAALADCFNQLGTVLVGGGSPQQYRPRAAAEAIKALQIDPYSAEAHAALGFVEHYQRQWIAAEQEFRRAIELNPSYSLVRIWYANFLMSRNRMDEAIQQVYVGRDLDPFSLIVNTNVGWVLVGAGRYEDAIIHLEQTLALDSNYVQARARLSGALAWVGRYREAIEQANRLVVLTHNAPSMVSGLVAVQARAGLRTEAEATLRQLVARSRTEYVPPWSIATAFAALGDVENTVLWIDRAFDEGSNGVVYLGIDPPNPVVRRDPRFRLRLARAGLESGRE